MDADVLCYPPPPTRILPIPVLTPRLVPDSRRRLEAGLGASLAVLVGAAVAGTDADRLPVGTPRLTEVERVRLVLLPSSVPTRRGKPVRSLRRADFRLFEDGKPRDVTLFATESEASIALAFLLDLSGSMGLGGRLDQARGAIRSWLATLGKDDRAALIGFADGNVEWSAGFDEDRRVLLERLETLRPGGRTALYDALAAAPLLVDEGVQGRKAIVLLTDGVDNASVMPQLQATWTARRVGVPVYAVGFVPMEERLMTPRTRGALRVVERFTAETGGALVAVHDPDGLEAASRRIQDELRFQYVIGFHPSAAQRDGSFRRVRLETVDRDLQVRTRSGYYAEP